MITCRSMKKTERENRVEIVSESLDAVKASPAAKKAARDAGVSIAEIAAKLDVGMIKQSDVLSSMRKNATPCELDRAVNLDAQSNSCPNARIHHVHSIL